MNNGVNGRDLLQPLPPVGLPMVDLSEAQEIRLEKAVNAVRNQTISGYAAAQRFQVIVDNYVTMN